MNVDEQPPDENFHAHELSERTQASMSKTWSWIQGQLVETSKKAAQLAYEARCQPHPRRKLVWEVYSGSGLLGEQAEQLGAEVMRFGLHNGWDFSKLAHRRRLMNWQLSWSQTRSSCPRSALFGLQCRPSTCGVKRIGTSFGRDEILIMNFISSFARSSTCSK